MILLALRTVHEYIVPGAMAHGIKFSTRDQRAWASLLVDRAIPSQVAFAIAGDRD
jgi:hypothetical protein